uniref:Uncharacterized protein n=1 Tax=Davidia involucrata TaxID=16924 RepID=A0A5B7BW76_DAVIN
MDLKKEIPDFPKNWDRWSDLVCFFMEFDDAIVVFAIDSVTASVYHVVEYKRSRRLKRELGYTAWGSKIYILGGDIVEDIDSDEISYPLKVMICDLTKGTDFEEGPSLIGGKPCPLVFGVKGKIYAIAGNSSYSSHVDPPEPKFEFLDTENSSQGWVDLPEPPFSPNHRGGYLLFVEHLVVTGSGAGQNDSLYVLISSNCYYKTMFWFDLVEQKWNSHLNISDSVDLRVNNLTVYPWEEGACVVDSFLYQYCSLDVNRDRVGVSVYNLLYPRPKTGEQSASLLHGLEDVMSQVPPGNVSFGYLIHLGNQQFCLVVFFDPSPYFAEEPHAVITCTFRLFDDSTGFQCEPTCKGAFILPDGMPEYCCKMCASGFSQSKYT